METVVPAAASPFESAPYDKPRRGTFSSLWDFFPINLESLSFCHRFSFLLLVSSFFCRPMRPLA
jgi:hypothetical protein